MWIARDKDNELYAFVNKPKLINNIWDTGGYSIQLKTYLFPEITWDSKPVWRRFIPPEWNFDFNYNYVDS